MKELFYSPVDPGQIKREKQKARDMRQSQWWKQQLAQGRCYYCQEVFQTSELTMDHIVPMARGGRSVKGNLAVCCKTCNTNKKNKTPVELTLESLS